MMRLSLLFSSVLIGLTPLGAWAWNHQPGGDEEEPVKATVRVVEAPSVYEASAVRAYRAVVDEDEDDHRRAAKELERAALYTHQISQEVDDLRAQIDALRAEKAALEEQVRRERGRTQPKRAETRRVTVERTLEEEQARILKEFAAQRQALEAELQAMHAARQSERDALRAELEAARAELHGQIQAQAAARQQEMAELEADRHTQLQRLHEELAKIDPREEKRMAQKERELDRLADELARAAERIARTHEHSIEDLARQLEQIEVERERRLELGENEFERHIDELTRHLEHQSVELERALCDLDNQREHHLSERHRELEELERAMELEQEALEGHIEREAEELELHFERAAEEYSRIQEMMADELALDAESFTRHFEEAAEEWEVEMDLWSDELDHNLEAALEAWQDAFDDVEWSECEGNVADWAECWSGCEDDCDFECDDDCDCEDEPDCCSGCGECEEEECEVGGRIFLRGRQTHPTWEAFVEKLETNHAPEAWFFDGKEHDGRRFPEAWTRREARGRAVAPRAVERWLQGQGGTRGTTPAPHGWSHGKADQDDDGPGVLIHIHRGPVYIDTNGGQSRTLIHVPEAEGGHSPFAPQAPLAPECREEKCDDGVAGVPFLEDLPIIESLFVTGQAPLAPEVPPTPFPLPELKLEFTAPAPPIRVIDPAAEHLNLLLEGAVIESLTTNTQPAAEATTLGVIGELASGIPVPSLQPAKAGVTVLGGQPPLDQEEMLLELNALVREMLVEVKDLRTAIEDLREDVGQERASRKATSVGRAAGGGASTRLR